MIGSEHHEQRCTIVAEQSTAAAASTKPVTAFIWMNTAALRKRFLLHLASSGGDCNSKILCRRNAAWHDHYEDVGCIPNDASMPFCQWDSLPETYVAFYLDNQNKQTGTHTHVQLKLCAMFNTGNLVNKHVNRICTQLPNLKKVSHLKIPNETLKFAFAKHWKINVSHTWSHRCKQLLGTIIYIL